MRATMKVDTRDFARAIRRYKRATGDTWQDVVQRFAKATAMNLSRIIPPRSKKQGLAAVGRDSRRSTAGITAGFLSWLRSSSSSGSSGNEINTHLRRADGSNLEIDFDQVSESGAAVADHHEDRRDKRGRVRIPETRGVGGGVWAEPDRIVTDEGTAERELDEREKRVGMAKGSISAVIGHLGGRVPAWTRRHAELGGFRDDSENRRRPRIVFWSRLSYVHALVAHRMQWVFSSVTRSMMRELKRRLEAESRKFNRRR